MEIDLSIEELDLIKDGIIKAIEWIENPELNCIDTTEDFMKKVVEKKRQDFKSLGRKISTILDIEFEKIKEERKNSNLVR